MWIVLALLAHYAGRFVRAARTTCARFPTRRKPPFVIAPDILVGARAGAAQYLARQLQISAESDQRGLVVLVVEIEIV
jgi:hypothetical protein